VNPELILILFVAIGTVFLIVLIMVVVARGLFSVNKSLERISEYLAALTSLAGKAYTFAENESAAEKAKPSPEVVAAITVAIEAYSSSPFEIKSIERI
jgi:hypothetical protein